MSTHMQNENSSMEKDVAKGTVNCDGNLWKDKPLAHVKLPALKLVFPLKSFTLPMVQGLQWFLWTPFSPLLSQQEEQQSSSVFQMHTSLDTCGSWIMSQSVLALSWFNRSKLGKGADSRDWDVGWGQGQKDAASGRGHCTDCQAPQGHCSFQSDAGRDGKELNSCWGGILPSHREGRIHQSRLNSWVTKPKTY